MKYRIIQAIINLYLLGPRQSINKQDYQDEVSKKLFLQKIHEAVSENDSNKLKSIFEYLLTSYQNENFNPEITLQDLMILTNLKYGNDIFYLFMDYAYIYGKLRSNVENYNVVLSIFFNYHLESAITANNVDAIEYLLKNANRCQEDLASAVLLSFLMELNPDLLKSLFIKGFIPKQALEYIKLLPEYSDLTDCVDKVHHALTCTDSFQHTKYLLSACETDIELTLDLLGYFITESLKDSKANLICLKASLPSIVLCLSVHPSGSKVYAAMHTLLSGILIIDFNQPPNKSLFANDEEKRKYFQQYFGSYILALGSMVGTNDCLNNTNDNDCAKVKVDAINENNNAEDPAVISMQAELDIILAEYSQALERIKTIKPSFYTTSILNSLSIIAENFSENKKEVYLLLVEGYLYSKYIEQNLALKYLLKAIMQSENPAEIIALNYLADHQHIDALYDFAEQAAGKITPKLGVEKRIFTQDLLFLIESVALDSIRDIPLLALHLIALYATKDSGYFNADRALDIARHLLVNNVKQVEVTAIAPFKDIKHRMIYLLAGCGAESEQLLITLLVNLKQFKETASYIKYIGGQLSSFKFEPKDKNLAANEAFEPYRFFTCLKEKIERLKSDFSAANSLLDKAIEESPKDYRQKILKDVRGVLKNYEELIKEFADDYYEQVMLFVNEKYFGLNFDAKQAWPYLKKLEALCNLYPNLLVSEVKHELAKILASAQDKQEPNSKDIVRAMRVPR